eukprot:g5653.t1
MVKHNNIIPNHHFHKAWAGGSILRGRQLKVRCGFKQAPKKHTRRLKRAAKAERVAPRPAAGLLRPIVRSTTRKYSGKLRAGRGFTLQELKDAGINKKQARTIGIAVDFRRTNLSAEGLQANVQRLNDYKAKLVIFPRKRGAKHVKNGDSTKDECAAVVGADNTGALMPIEAPADEVEFASVPKQDSTAFHQIRIARSDARLIGIRAKRAADKAAAEKEKGKKKKKK